MKGTVRFDETHMEELEVIFNVTSDQKSGLDTLPEIVAELLQTFRFAMEEGADCIVHTADEMPYINGLLTFIHQYCTSRYIDYEIKVENDLYMLYLN